MKTMLKNLTIPALCLGLGACSTSELAVSSVSDLDLRPSVEMVRVAFDIAAEDDGTDTPSLGTYDALYTFFERTNVGYGDAVVLDAGRGVSKSRIDAIERFVRERGLDYGGAHIVGPAPKDGVITAYIERYVVIPPECGEWAPESTRDRRNNPSSYFACATTRNLALMVASPRDLIDGQRGSGNGNAVSAIQLFNAQQRQAAGGGNTPILRFDASQGGLSMGLPGDLGSTGSN